MKNFPGMNKRLKLMRLSPWLTVFGLLILLSACNSRVKISNRTLILNVKRTGNQLKYVNHKVKKIPYYEYHSNEPLFKGVVYNSNGKKLGSFLFGNIFFMNKGTVHQLTFPDYPGLHKIVIYKLNSSSGHITNKNKQVALSWILPGSK